VHIARRELLVGSLGCAATACAPSAPKPASTAAPASGTPVTLPPLDDALYTRRLEHLRSLTRAAGADVAFVGSGVASFTYLAGGAVERSERLIALFVPVAGAPFLVAPSFEVERMRRQTRVATVEPWEEQQSPYAVAATALSRAAPGARAILVEPHTEYATALALSRAIPGATLFDSAGAFGALRVVKEEAELARMRRAVAITERAFEDAFASLREGDRDLDVSDRIHDAMVRLGADDGYALVQFGPLSALPHGRPVGARLGRGTCVLVDGGAKVDGYWSDITRTRWFGGPPPDEALRVHATVHDAQSAALARARPGVAAQEIDRAAREVITRAGYGRSFTHRTGHGLGMEGHEPIYMVEGNDTPLVEGCVFTIEPGIYLVDRFGVRIEDDVVCTNDGALLLSTRAPREMRAT
jgi:Xaa-Pro dipeptidase